MVQEVLDPSATSEAPGAILVRRAATARTSRRHFVKGTTVVAGGLVAASYVKPNLRELGVPGALAQAPSGPPDGGGGIACSPGAFANTAGVHFVPIWDTSPDQQWTDQLLALSAVVPPYSVGGAPNPPFTHSDLVVPTLTGMGFNFPPLVDAAATGGGTLKWSLLSGTIFYSTNPAADELMVGGGPQPVAALRQVANHILCVYLFGHNAPYSMAQLIALWNAAVTANTLAAFDALTHTLDNYGSWTCPPAVAATFTDSFTNLIVHTS